MDITNVLENAELQKRFEALRSENWLISKMAEDMFGKTAKELLDNWPTATRKELLKKLNIIEHPDYPFLYQDSKE